MIKLKSLIPEIKIIPNKKIKNNNELYNFILENYDYFVQKLNEQENFPSNCNWENSKDDFTQFDKICITDVYDESEDIEDATIDYYRIILAIDEISILNAKGFGNINNIVLSDNKIWYSVKKFQE